MKLEDQRQFEVGGSVDPNDADISLTCLRCDWTEWLPVGADDDGPQQTLADLQALAGSHLAQSHRTDGAVIPGDTT